MILRDILETSITQFTSRKRSRQVRRDRIEADRVSLKALGKYRDELAGEIHDISEPNDEFIVM